MGVGYIGIHQISGDAFDSTPPPQTPRWSASTPWFFLWLMVIYPMMGIQTQWVYTYTYIYMVTDRIMEKKIVQLRQAAPASDFSIIGFFPIRV